MAHRAEGGIDAARRRVGGTHRRGAPISVVPYREFGTSESLGVSGRVLETKRMRAIAEGSSWRAHLANMLRRLESDEVPGARVRASFLGRTVETVTDEEGYFRASVAPAEPLEPTRVWHSVDVQLVEPLSGLEGAPKVAAEVLVPPPTASFGVISDIDDTVVWTGVEDKLRMAKIVFFDDARTRLPFEGVAAFYRALQAGPTGAEGNPIFYVSGSPWNLYDFLVELFEYHAIPTGPLMLRDLGLSATSLVGADPVEHKLSSIARIFETYPTLPFLLVGDSGERDPEIYREVVARYPGRVRAVYIRNVSKRAERDRSISALADEVLAAGSVLVLAPDSLTAAQHAAERGWLAPDALDAVRRSKARDERSPSAAEPVPEAERPPERVEGE